ncbi:CAZyme family PL7 [Paecilomyces variotii]|nr:CAZyme family PL7 [Paecilomyces variotii]
MSSTAILALLFSTAIVALNPSCAPGGNFDLSKWNLQLPIGSAGSPTTISSSALQGCNGYQDPDHHPSSWDPNAATNRLSATLKVTQADDSSYGTVIGQIHIDDSVSSKPVCELFYNSNGDISIGVEQTRSGGNEVVTYVDNVPVDTTFSYEIQYESNVLSVSINGGAAKTFSTYSLDAPESYFKLGNYNQGDSPSDVHFTISTQH